MKFLSGVLVCLILIGVAAGLAVFGGRVPVGATTSPDIIDKLAPIARDRSIARHASAMRIESNAEAAKRGMKHYAEDCMPCHGAPGGKALEFAEGLNPKAPTLDGPHTQAFGDGELFWIVKNGIRATGMPAFGVNHKDADIQDIVVFLRHLTQLTADEKRDLSGGGLAEHHLDEPAPESQAAGDH